MWNGGQDLFVLIDLFHDPDRDYVHHCNDASGCETVTPFSVRFRCIPHVTDTPVNHAGVAYNNDSPESCLPSPYYT